MRYSDYDYDYHNLADNSDFIDDDEDTIDSDEVSQYIIKDEYTTYTSKYSAYYHDITDELDD